MDGFMTAKSKEAVRGWRVLKLKSYRKRVREFQN